MAPANIALPKNGRPLVLIWFLPVAGLAPRHAVVIGQTFLGTRRLSIGQWSPQRAIHHPASGDRNFLPGENFVKKPA